MEKIKVFLSICLGLIGAFTKQYGIMIVIVALAIVFDIVTGLIKANMQGTVSSKVGTKGFLKKIALMVCLFFGFFLDYIIPYMCSKASINVSIAMPFGMVICFYIVLNECISVCENLYACNPTIMPEWVIKILQSAKQQIEESGKNEDSK